MPEDTLISTLSETYGHDVTSQMIAYLVKEELVLVNEDHAFKLTDSTACRRINRFVQNRHSSQDLDVLIQKGLVKPTQPIYTAA